MPPARGRRRRPSTRNRRLNRISLVIIGICAVIFIIVGLAGSHGTKPTAQGTITPTASGGSVLATASTTPAAVSQPPASIAPPASSRPASQPPTVRASTPKSASPKPSSAAPSAARTGCYPLSNEGTCYEPGEYCRDDDHGMTGVAGDGEKIVCEDNDGWRWEPD
jgi:hypothetical protein